MRKRFTAFILTSGLMTLALYFADPTTAPTYLQYLGLVYAVYLGGQSATDWREASK